MAAVLANRIFGKPDNQREANTPKAGAKTNSDEKSYDTMRPKQASRNSSQADICLRTPALALRFPMRAMHRQRAEALVTTGSLF